MKNFFLYVLLLVSAVSQAQTFGELYYEQLSKQGDPRQMLRVHLKLARPCSLDSSGISFERTVYVIDQQSNTIISVILNLDSSKQLRYTNDPCIVSPSQDCYTVFYLHADIRNSFSGIFGFVTYLGCCRSFENLLYEQNTEEFNNIAYSLKIPAPSQNVYNNNAYFTTDTILHSCQGEPFAYNLKAFDTDSDSLVYSFVKATQYRVSKKNGVITDIVTPPYPTYFYKFPFDTLPPLGSQVNIDSKTGTISGVINQAGNFLITVQVAEYRSGVFISSHTKDIPINVFDCLKLQKPNALLPDTINDCNSFTQSFPNNSNSLSSYFFWNFGDSSFSQDIFPEHTYKDTGRYLVKLFVNKGYSCADSAFSQVLIYPTLKPSFTHTDSCSSLPVTFYSSSSSTYGLINSYKWIFENVNHIADTINGSSIIRHSFSTGEKSYLVKLEITTTNKCRADDSQYVDIYSTPDPLPIHDTTIAFGYSYQIEPDMSGVNNYSRFSWFPTTGLDNPFIPNPIVRYNQNETYRVVIASPFNCIRQDSIRIIYFIGPDVYVPSAFTPNNDGLNDVLNIKLVGMKFLDFFIIYDRFGRKIFEDNNKIKNGWDGNINRMPAPQGVYVWVLKAIDLNGKPFIKKGTLVLIR